MLFGALAGLGCLVLGIGLIAAAFHEFWLVSRLRDHGLQAQADVRLEGVIDEHQRVALREYTTKAVSYSYSFQVQGKTYWGSASSSDDRFMESLQKEKAKAGNFFNFPFRVGSVTVTYLPEDPSWHRFGRVDQPQVAEAQGNLWWGIPMGVLFALTGALGMLGCYFGIRDGVPSGPHQQRG